MNRIFRHLDRCARRRGLAAACGWLALASNAATARGQCDPQEIAKLIASDAAASDNFGFAVAVDGDTAVVGSYRDVHAGGPGTLSGQGSAYVFVRSGGIWTQQAKLTASDADAADLFGNAVAISGDTVVVGAFQESVGPNPPMQPITLNGAAYVFVRSGTTWTEQVKLRASSPSSLAHFGSSVAVSGDTAVVGARAETHPGGGGSQGAAYVFERVGATWNTQARLTASDVGSGDQFGWSVAVSGDTVLVGAYSDDLPAPAGTDAGSAYVFVRGHNGNGVWDNGSADQQTKLTAADAAASDFFGSGVALSGDTAVVGAYLDDHTIGNDGSAYVFVRAGAVWTQQGKFTASDPDGNNNQEFGRSVAVSGDTVLVGARVNNRPGVPGAGAAYLFFKPTGGWSDMTETDKLTASDAAAGDNFGMSVAVSGDSAVAGTWSDNHPSQNDAGSAYVFDLNCSPAACCAGDFDASNAVTIADIPDFVAALLAGSSACPPLIPCCPGDLNADGLVDGNDVSGFVVKLLGGGACA